MTDPNDIPYVAVKSPLALVGVFLQILRERFSESQQLQWVYVPGDGGRALSTIHIEAGGNPETEDLARRPAIFVNRGPITFTQPVIGDQAGAGFEKGIRAFYAMAETNFVFSVESEEAGEAEQIADLLLSTLMMGSYEIVKAFLFRKLGPFAMSSRAKTRQDTELTVISINAGLSYDVRWRTIPIAPILKEVIVKARESTYTDGNEFFSKIYQSSLRDSPNSTT